MPGDSEKEQEQEAQERAEDIFGWAYTVFPYLSWPCPKTSILNHFEVLERFVRFHGHDMAQLFYLILSYFTLL